MDCGVSFPCLNWNKTLENVFTYCLKESDPWHSEFCLLISFTASNIISCEMKKNGSFFVNYY